MARRMFPGRTRSLLRHQNRANLPDVCDRMEARTVREPGGITATKHEAVEFDLPCFLAPASGAVQERVFGPQVEPLPRWMVRLPAYQKVGYTDVLRVTMHATGEIVHVAVEGIEGPRSEESTRIVVGKRVEAPEEP